MYMPELPDVEVYTQSVRKHILKKTIASVSLLKESLLESPKKDLEELKGSKIISIERHGKYCFIHTDIDTSFIFHFGMTGKLVYSQKDNSPHDAALTVTFSDDSTLTYTNMRKLGKIILSNQKELFLKNSATGPDAFNLTQDQFIDLISSKQGMIKTALMDQSVLSGIGNLYSDEILYHAKINPRRKTTDIQPNKMKRLHAQEKQVLRTAIKTKAHPKEMPEDWLIHRRKQGMTCGICSGEIEKITINGRGAYFCPKHQL
jgi:formamidopyrimidine-DNA glycosylase